MHRKIVRQLIKYKCISFLNLHLFIDFFLRDIGQLDVIFLFILHLIDQLNDRLAVLHKYKLAALHSPLVRLRNVGHVEQVG